MIFCGAQLKPAFIASADGTTSVTIPATQVGDWIGIVASRHLDGTIPDLGSGGDTFTSTAFDTTVVANAGTASIALRWGWRIDDDTSPALGSWANAQHMLALIYRGVHPTAPVLTAAFAEQTSNTETVQNWPAMTMAIKPALVLGSHKMDNNVTLALDARLTSRAERSAGTTETEAGDSGVMRHAWAAGTATSSSGTETIMHVLSLNPKLH